MAQVSVFLLLSVILTIFTPLVTMEDSPTPLPLPLGKPSMTPTLAIILVCLISTFVLTCFLSIYVRRSVHHQITQILFPGPTFHPGQDRWPWHEEVTARGIDPRTVACFPTFFYSEVKELKIGQCALECVVCLNEFEDEETLLVLPKCWHVFHPDCIQLWLSSHITCPVCRADLLDQISHQVPQLRHPSLLEPDIPVGRHPIILEPDVIATDNDQSPNEITAVDSPAKRLPPRSISRRERKFRVAFQKSLSTGHSLVLPGENSKKFTLRLPDEIRTKLLSSGLERARSCHVEFPRARSGKMGFKSTSCGGCYDRFEQDGGVPWWVITATPSFFTRAGPSTAHVSEGIAEATRPSVGLFKSVTSPLNRLFGEASIPKDGVKVEEQSADVLILDSKV